MLEQVFVKKRVIPMCLLLCITVYIVKRAKEGDVQLIELIIIDTMILILTFSEITLTTVFHVVMLQNALYCSQI